MTTSDRFHLWNTLYWYAHLNRKPMFLSILSVKFLSTLSLAFSLSLSLSLSLYYFFFLLWHIIKVSILSQKWLSELMLIHPGWKEAWNNQVIVELNYWLNSDKKGWGMVAFTSEHKNQRCFYGRVGGSEIGWVFWDGTGRLIQTLARHGALLSPSLSLVLAITVCPPVLIALAPQYHQSRVIWSTLGPSPQS